MPAATTQAGSAPPATGADDLAGQLAGLQPRLERLRTSDAEATLAPRGERPGIGGSMRLPASAAAALVGRDHHFQSARHDLPYVPESPPGSPEPYAAPRRDGGFMSGLKKGLKALGFGGSGRSDSTSSDVRTIYALPPHRDDEVADAPAAPQDSPPAEMPAPQAPRAPRRRRRDADTDAIRRVAGAAVRAEQTTIPPPTRGVGKKPHPDDVALIQRANAGLAASNPRVHPETHKVIVQALTHFSAWLAENRRPAMQGRLFTAGLLADAHKFTDLGGYVAAPSALGHLREIESSRTGTANVPSHAKRRHTDVPAEDEALIQRAFVGTNHTVQTYRTAVRAFSEWLAHQGHPALTAPVCDSQGQVTSLQLHSDEVTRLAKAYLNSVKNKDLVRGLRHLRTFDLTGATNIGKRNSHFGIPEADARLIARYTKGATESAAASSTAVKGYAGNTRAFSDWLQDEGRPSIAARLHDDRLFAELELYADPKSSKFRGIRRALLEMKDKFPPEDPDVTFGRIGHDLFVRALGALAVAPDITVGKTAEDLVADVDDLLVFLDARAEDGLTRAGRELVQTFDGRALQAARANIAQRRQMMAMAATQRAGTSPGQALPPLEATPVGWSQVWSDAAATPHQDFSSAGSIHPAHHRGGFGFELNEPSEETGREQTDSAYAGLSSFGSVPGYDDQRAHARSLWEVPGPSGPPQRARTDSAYDGLSSIGSVPGYDAPQAYARSPSEVAGPSRPAPEVTRVDDYPSPAGQGTDFERRLEDRTAWLQSDDLWNHSQEFLASFARELGPGGRARIDRMISIGDPSVLVRHLLNGTARQREAARAQLTAPTVLLPVNNPHNHWSLLVVHRDARQATHYDSAIPPHLARTPVAVSTEQFALARQVAAALGIDAVGSMPMAPQPDAHSCGDHVLAGIETLARRLVTGQHEDLWNLSGIRPSRQHVIDTLSRAQAPELDDAVAGQWVHGDRYASPEVLHALATAGALPTEARPQTTLRIRGQRYEALLVDGNVWLHWTPARDRELSPGPAAMDRATLLGRLGVEMGNASGHGLNCLLDSIVQLANGTRRRRASVPELDGLVQTMREMLANVGVVDRHGQIDVYEGANAGALLAQTFRMRLQFIQDNGDNGVFVHPVIGHEGALLRILHTPGHFQPLWPSRQP